MSRTQTEFSISLKFQIGLNIISFDSTPVHHWRREIPKGGTLTYSLVYCSPKLFVIGEDYGYIFRKSNLIIKKY